MEHSLQAIFMIGSVGVTHARHTAQQIKLYPLHDRNLRPL